MDQTGLHVLLGLYLYLIQTQAGRSPAYIAPVWLVVCTGIWCGPLYYFGRHVDLVLNHPESAWLRAGADPRLLSRWSKAGCAMSTLSVYVKSVDNTKRIVRANTSTQLRRPHSLGSVYSYSYQTTTSPARKALRELLHICISLSRPPSTPPHPSPPRAAV